MREVLITLSMLINICSFNKKTHDIIITQKDFSAHYTGCFFQYCFFVETEGAGINSPLLKENVSEMELVAVNEGTDLSLKQERMTQNFGIYCLF
jgi:hypothetical protein